MSGAVDRARPPAGGVPRPIPRLDFERGTLAGGLVLALAPRHDRPLIDLDLVLPAGGERNPPSRPGLSQLTASLLDEGTRRQGGRELSAGLERRGCGLGTASDWNAASIHLSLPAGELEFALALVAELLLEPAFPERELERLRRRGLAEIARRVDDPGTLAEEAFAHELYAGTPYGELLLGTAASLAAIERGEVEGFHRDHYRLAGAKLVVAGDLPADRIAGLVERTFAAAPVSSPEPDVAVDPAPLDGVRVVIVDRPGAAQTELRVGHAGVPRRHPDRAGLGFLNALLGGKFTSRINLNLRERLGITYGAHSRFVDRRSAGPFLVSCAVSNDSVGLGAMEILGEISRLRDVPVAAVEIEETRSYLLGVFPYGLQTVEGLAARLRDIALHDLPLDHTERVIEVYRAIDAVELTRLARTHLAPHASLVVAAGPAAEIAPQLAELGAARILRPEGPRAVASASPA